ncbi:MAG TPA: hypothetical protein PKN56_19975 [Leptospiraceae bacterium]|nr:hypothetical protein [Leptospiraceae bacterium]HNF23592.1 hypothetical protein [Leptospiraceae bacterium]HNI95681.1 hypothetical protein [Leptospiraceae bacterium]HNM03300.1 hypothetical protein [Leptospiraceae bacterium]HNN05849.1 hypothetical protein [Leptospiraceae bacterium]
MTYGYFESAAAEWSLEKLLETYTVSDMQMLSKICGIPAKTKKGDLVSSLSKFILSNAFILYEKLKPISKKAVQETVHRYNGVFDFKRFEAKYNELPSLTSSSYYYRENPEAEKLSVLIFKGVIPSDLRHILKEKVPVPDKFDMEYADQLPASYELKRGEKRELTVRLTEAEALKNIKILFALAESGKIKGSEKTGIVSEAGREIIEKQLFAGDFYAGNESDLKIQSFSLPLIFVSSGYARYENGRLKLTLKGIKERQTESAQLLKDIWQKWMNSSFDEFERIDNIKGRQKGLAKNVKERRNVIIKALLKMPKEKWVRFSKFSQFMRLNSMYFSVARNSWDLYIGDREYGSLGYDGYDSWEVLQERYILALFFEYAATLGILDIAYVEPEFAKSDFYKNWGTDDLSYLSRYDGLICFRINVLGRFILGIEDKYVPVALPVEKTIKIMQNLEIAVSKELNKEDQLFLEALAVKSADYMYRLEEKSILHLLEKGHTIDTVTEFLKARSQNELPSLVLDFLDRIKRKSGLINNLGSAKVLKISDRPTALLIANSSRLKKLCFFAEPDLIIILLQNEQKFFKELKSLGYSISQDILI